MNLAHIIDEHPGAAPALIGPEGVLDYGRLRRAVGQWRTGLSQAGVVIGDRVALLMDNGIDFALTYLAILGLGAVAVPLNPASPGPELARELAAVGPVAAVVGPSGASGLSRLSDWPDSLKVVVLTRGARLNEPAAPSGGGERVTVAESVAWADLDGTPMVDTEPDDLAVLLFTAGTAGFPKAAMLTHANLASNLDQVQHHPGRAVRPGDVVLGVLPVFHIFGLNVVLGLALAGGASLVLLPRFDAFEVASAVSRHQVTVLAGVPPMFEALVGAAEVADDALGSLRVVISGASGLDPEVAKRFTARFGPSIIEGYGLTEASPVVTSCIPGQEPRLGSIGPPLPGVEVRLVDEDGMDALDGDAGEIWVRGPNVFPGYWDDPAATQAALTAEGWLRTGDVAVADTDGYLHIVDRAKDLIIVSGFNVYPAEVEQVLIMHPGVAEVAVVGVSGVHKHEAVAAFVVPDGPVAPPEAELVDLCRRHLARYKCPTEFHMVGSIPHGIMGKLLRRKLGT
ncbi:MAG: AMP-binding protein [Acidimicrobiales bacterium]